ncbi:hypothetical protein KSP39_PZI022245 [Platanthera zijinensis]|uniref:Uncharacterized protein n=1 Tax=Platanthera zijinensis TaxID=2320716 RepID=A0AAP0AUK4_9ASPA
MACSWRRRDRRVVLQPLLSADLIEADQKAGEEPIQLRMFILHPRFNETHRNSPVHIPCISDGKHRKPSHLRLSPATHTLPLQPLPLFSSATLAPRMRLLSLGWPGTILQAMAVIFDFALNSLILIKGKPKIFYTCFTYASATRTSLRLPYAFLPPGTSSFQNSEASGGRKNTRWTKRGAVPTDKTCLLCADEVLRPSFYVVHGCRSTELYEKLNRMAIIALDMFTGRERFSTLLMMRLTETVVLWLSEDQTFWEDMEEGPRPFGKIL